MMKKEYGLLSFIWLIPLLIMSSSPFIYFFFPICGGLLLCFITKIYAFLMKRPTNYYDTSTDIERET